ncbi:hypothetical protein B0H13DRAFT_1711154, partial [Mycena leptocephala]
MFCGRSFPSPTMSSPLPSKRGTSAAMLLLLQVLFFICSAIPHVQTISVNRTIDDTYGDPSTGTYPTYNTEDWIASPVNGYAIDDTLHGCGRPTVDGACSMTLHFEGTAIYVFGYCESSSDVNLNTSVTLDGGPTRDIPFASPMQFVYNCSLYSKTGLENTNHTLTLAAITAAEDVQWSFDFAIYTQEEPDPVSPTSATSSSLAALRASKKRKLAGPITGGVIGGLLLCGVLGFLACRARPGQRTHASVSADGSDVASEKQTPPRLSQPLPAAGSSEVPGPTLPHEEWTPAPVRDTASVFATTHLSGETQFSLAERGVTPAVLAMEDKTAQQLSVHRDEVAPRAHTPVLADGIDVARNSS